MDGKQALAALGTLPEPDELGDAQYRLVHEFVNNLLDDDDIDAYPRVEEYVLASLDEIANAVAMFRKAFKQDERYVVDGAVYPDDPDGPLYQADGQYPPFVIFDVEKQDNLPGRYDTRALAEAALLAIVARQ